MAQTNGTENTKSMSGMMPDQTSIISIIGKVAKGTGAVASAFGVSVTAIIPAIMLLALLLPVLLAPLTPALNAAFLGYVGYSILKRTGKLPEGMGRKGQEPAPQRGQD